MEAQPELDLLKKLNTFRREEAQSMILESELKKKRKSRSQESQSKKVEGQSLRIESSRKKLKFIGEISDLSRKKKQCKFASSSNDKKS